MEGEWFKDISVDEVLRKYYLGEDFRVPCLNIEKETTPLPCQGLSFRADKVLANSKFSEGKITGYGCSWEWAIDLKKVLGEEPVSYYPFDTGIKTYSTLLFNDPYLVPESIHSYKEESIVRIADIKCAADFCGRWYIWMPNKDAAINFQKDKLDFWIEKQEENLVNLWKFRKDTYGKVVIPCFMSEYENMKTELRTDLQRIGIEKAKAEGKFKGKQQSIKTINSCEKALELIESGLSKEKAAKAAGVGIATLYRYIKSKNVDKEDSC